MKMNRGILLVIGLMLSQAYVGQAMAMNGTRVEFGLDECPICAEKMDEYTEHITTCDHKTCVRCYVIHTIKNKGNCPFCRSQGWTNYELANPANRFMALVNLGMSKPLGAQLSEAITFNDKDMFDKAMTDIKVLSYFAPINLNAKRLLGDALTYQDGVLKNPMVLAREKGKERYLFALERIRVN